MTVRRTYDWEDIHNQTKKYMQDLPCFWPEDWVSSDKNIALTNDVGDIGMYDYQPTGYEAHLYYTSRGRQALDVAVEMVQWFFDNTTEDVIFGETPILHKAAWLLARKTGFQRVSIIRQDHGPMYRSIMTRYRWETLHPPAR